MQYADIQLGHGRSDLGVFLLDLANALNFVPRKAFIQDVSRRLFEIYAWVQYAYRFNKHVFWNGGLLPFRLKLSLGRFQFQFTKLFNTQVLFGPNLFMVFQVSSNENSLDPSLKKL